MESVFKNVPPSSILQRFHEQTSQTDSGMVAADVVQTELDVDCVLVYDRNSGTTLSVNGSDIPMSENIDHIVSLMEDVDPQQSNVHVLDHSGQQSKRIGATLLDNFYLFLTYDMSLDWTLLQLERIIEEINGIYAAISGTVDAHSAGGIAASMGRSRAYFFFDTTDESFRTVGDTDGLRPALDALSDGLPHYLEHVDPADQPSVELAWERASSSGAVESLHRVHVGAESRWVHLVASVTMSDENQPGSMLGLVSDVFESSHRWDELVRFRKLIDDAGDGIYLIDRDTGQIQDVNNQACEQLGYAYDELVGMTVFDIDPDFTPDLWEEFRGTVKADGSVRLSATHQRKDGSTFDVEIVVSYAQLAREYHIAIVRDQSEGDPGEATLSAEMQRYRTLIESSPDGLMVVEADSFDILDINQTGADLLMSSRRELLEQSLSGLVSPSDRERFVEIVRRMTEYGRSIRRYDDGSQLTFVTVDDKAIPVSISCNQASVAGRAVIFIAFRDIADQREYEQTLASLNEASQQLLAATSEYDIAETIISTAKESLDLSGVAFYQFDQEEYALTPLIYSEDLSESVGEPPTLPLEGSLAGRVFTNGATERYDNVRTTDGVYNPETPFRSEIIAPVGEYGVVLVGSEYPDQYDQLSVDLLEVLISNAKTAFNRNERERQLRERELELSQKTESLERVKELNEQIRHLTRTLVQLESKQEIESAICEHLANTGSITLAWIGEVDPIDEVVEPRAWSGGDGYLEAIDLDLTAGESGPPSIEAIQTGEPVYISNCATDIESASWRREAIRRSYKSVFVVPITHRDINYGILSLYSTEPGALDEEFRSVITEVGTTIAYALNSINRKQAIISNQTTEIDFAVSDPRCFFLRASDASGCSIELNGLIPQDDEGTLGFISVTGGDVEDLTEYLENSTIVRSHRVLTSDDTPLVQLRLIGPFIGTQLAEYGLKLRRASSEQSSCLLTVSVPPTIELNHAVDIMETFFDSASPVGKRERGLTDTAEQPLPDRYLGKLTDRQREAIELAFRRGYFDVPKGATGAELAEDMDISHSAFHNHLRTAERRLFEVLFGDRETLT